MKFNMLTVLDEQSGVDSSGRKLWWCECDCGEVVLAIASVVKSGGRKSCGCQKYAFSTTRKTHGKSGSQVYKAWKRMKQRCDNTNYDHYDDYGGRGITYEPRWKTFQPFYEDMGDPPEGMTLERLDGNGNYTKDNCVWASWTVQNNNKRNNVRYTYAGQSLTLGQWSKVTGIKRLTLFQRLNRGGYTLEEALTTTDRLVRDQVLYRYKDKSLTITELAKETGVNRVTIQVRLARGLSVEQAVSEKGLYGPSWLGKDPRNKRSGERYEFEGKTLTLTEWSRETGIGRVTLLKRIQRGVPLHLALTVKGYLDIDKPSEHADTEAKEP